MLRPVSSLYQSETAITLTLWIRCIRGVYGWRSCIQQCIGVYITGWRCGQRLVQADIPQHCAWTSWYLYPPFNLRSFQFFPFFVLWVLITCVLFTNVIFTMALNGDLWQSDLGIICQWGCKNQWCLLGHQVLLHAKSCAGVVILSVESMAVGNQVLVEKIGGHLDIEI